MQKCYVVCFAKENVQMLFCKTNNTTPHFTKQNASLLCFFYSWWLCHNCAERHSCKATMHFAMQNAPIPNYKNIKNKEHFST
jgi:hypothetical protein